MTDELYKALSKGYADEDDQLNAIDLIDNLRAENARLKEALFDMCQTVAWIEQIAGRWDNSIKPVPEELLQARAALAHGETD